LEEVAVDVLVCGASIAGPVLAYWLHRFGFTVTVVEKAPALRIGDAGYCPGPAVGGSTSLAVVGAYTLAGAAARGDHTIAYPAYEHALADYARRSRSFARRMATQLIPRSRLHAWAMTTGVKLVTTLPAPLLRAAASRTRRLGLHDIVTVRPYDDEGRQGGEVQ
jgi:2-polyprenyl-6-methoxyphenol hydroxylase-like FAD-dependent oxidoreductase